MAGAEISSRTRRRKVCLELIGFFSLLISIVLFSSGALSYIENKTVDLRFTVRGSRSPKNNIVIVSIDDMSISKVDVKWPFPRSFHERVLDNISSQEPQLVFFDLLFTEPDRDDPSEDQALAEAMRRSGKTVLPSLLTSVEDERTGYRMVTLREPIEVLFKEARAVGFANSPMDGDGVVRRATLAVAQPGSSTLQKKGCYSAALEMLAVLRSLGEGDISVSGDKISVGKESITVDRENSIPINFRGGPGTFKRISYYQVLAGRSPAGVFEGAVVMVGTTSPSLHDVYSTPFALSGSMPGVEIQANVLDMLLSRDFMKGAPRWLTIIIIAALGLVVFFCTTALSPLKGIFAALGTLVAYLIAAQLLFQRGIALDVTGPALGVLLPLASMTIFRYATEEREKRRLRSVFSRYVDRSVVDEIVERTDEITLGGERREVTVLFSDIKGFTALSENLEPEMVISLLNEYFSEITSVITANGGVVDKFIGDAIMAVFGVPLRQEDHAMRAVRSAVQMHDKVVSLAGRWSVQGKPPLEAGIGIHTGEAVVGNVGSNLRMEYTAIGDTVNLASRLEGLTWEHDSPMIISEATYREVSSLVEAEFIASVKVKGREEPVVIYRLLGLR